MQDVTVKNPIVNWPARTGPDTAINCQSNNIIMALVFIANAMILYL